MKHSAVEDQAIVKAMEASGQRLTRQKMEVFHFMQKNGMNHPSAEEVYFGVKRTVPSISLATVYNCLESLVGCKLLNRVDIAGSHTHRYEMRSEAHHHFRCVGCGRIVDVRSSVPLGSVLPPAGGYEITDFQLQLSGYCPECGRKKRNNGE